MSEIAKALLAFQKQAPSLVKTQEGQVGTRRYKYLGLEDAMATIRPVLNQAGLVVTQPLIVKDGQAFVNTELVHAESGEAMGSVVLLPGTENMQAFGSAITYARRYSLLSLLGLVGEEDDDGSKSSGRGTAAATRPETVPGAGGVSLQRRDSGSGREPSSTLTAAAEIPQDQAARGRDAQKVSSLPDTDSDERTEEQKIKYHALMSDLKKFQGQDYWLNKFAHYRRNKLGIPDGARLGRDEFEALLGYMETNLYELKAPLGLADAEGVPFDGMEADPA